MQIYIWWGMFFVLIILSVIVLVRGIVSRMNAHTYDRIEMLEAKVKKLEEKLENRT